MVPGPRWAPDPVLSRVMTPYNTATHLFKAIYMGYFLPKLCKYDVNAVDSTWF